MLSDLTFAHDDDTLGLCSFNLLAPAFVRVADQPWNAYEWVADEAILDAERRASRSREILLASNADVITLQEVQLVPTAEGKSWNLPPHLLQVCEEGGYDYVISPSPTATRSNKELSKEADRNEKVCGVRAPAMVRATLLRHARIEQVAEPLHSSQGLAVFVRVRGSTALWSIANVHLPGAPERHADRLKAMQSIYERMLKGPASSRCHLVAAGDFNCQDISNMSVEAAAADTQWTAADSTVLRDACTSATTASPGLAERIDHVLTGPSVCVLSVSQGLDAESIATGLPSERVPSDHIPVAVRLRGKAAEEGSAAAPAEGHSLQPRRLSPASATAAPDTAVHVALTAPLTPHPHPDSVAVNIAALDVHMRDHSYAVGFAPTTADVELFQALEAQPSVPHAARWYRHIEALGRRTSLPCHPVPPALLAASAASAAPAAAPPAASPPAATPPAAAAGPQLTGKAAKARSRELSQMLSMLLRHQAKEKGIAIDEDGGWVLLADALAHVNALTGDEGLEGGFPATPEEVRSVVRGSDKQRFAMRGDGAAEQIRANQGHSMQGIVADLEPIGAEKVPLAVHGTYFAAWESIKAEGLSRMSRTHVHMARDVPGASGVVSGMRSSCEVLVWVSIAAAEALGLHFYESANGVILAEGPIPPSCFQKVVVRRTGEALV